MMASVRSTFTGEGYTADMLIHPAEARRQFRELADEDITNQNLARGALLIALEDNPRLDVESYLDELAALAVRVERRCVAGESAIFRLGHLHAELFDVDGYRGDTSSYYDPRNACLNEVIDRKLGIPITLSVVYIEIGARLGLKLEGVSFPSHFLVKCALREGAVILDPYAR
ncbi:MAG: hypothetical protein QOH21_3799, partial [Acidobacteriota bacterium]|nr:hypothetical protein [Acidobacteriota bacterium]